MRRLSIPPRRDALLSIEGQIREPGPHAPKFTKYTKSLARYGTQPSPLVKHFEFSSLVIGHQSGLGAQVKASPNPESTVGECSMSDWLIPMKPATSVSDVNLHKLGGIGL
jgi:hypothetical protein